MNLNDPGTCSEYPVGTRIRFTETLTEPANEDRPAAIFARAGELGAIVGHGTREGYWVTWDGWPHAFGAAEHEFEVVSRKEEKERRIR